MSNKKQTVNINVTNNHLTVGTTPQGPHLSECVHARTTMPINMLKMKNRRFWKNNRLVTLMISINDIYKIYSKFYF